MTPTMPTTAELLPLLPELVLVGVAFARLMIDLFVDEKRRGITNLLAIVALLAVAAMIACGVGGQGTVLGVFAAGVLLIGIWPKPLTDLMEPSIAQLAGQLAASKL